MVVYTKKVKEEAGSLTAVLNQINVAISLTNTAMDNSNVLIKANLVHTYETDYVESGNLGTDLDRIEL